MPNEPSQWLESKKQFVGQKYGKALVKWLNDPHVSPKFIEELLLNTQVVFRWLAEYVSVRELVIAHKKKKLPPAFWDSHEKLNEVLAKFTYAPQIDLHEFPDGERVSWTLVAEEPP